MPPKIQFDAVCKQFALPGKLFEKKSLHALRAISLSIEEGETLAVVGESGCGKTTLARLLMNLYSPSSGNITVRDGETILHTRTRQADRKYRSHIQMIFQDPFASLNPAHSVENILRRAITIHKKTVHAGEINHRIEKLLETVGLTPASDFMAKYPAQLSGGQRQRIVIARALAVEPSVIVADEPTSMLDVSIGVDIMNLLLQLRHEKKLTMLYITHNLASARYMADHIAVLYAGECVEYGPIDEVIAHPYHPYTVLLLNSTPEPFRENEVELAASEETPDLTSVQPLCRFCARCPLAQKRCFTESPTDFIDGKRRVRCFLYTQNGTAAAQNVSPRIYHKTTERENRA